MEIDQIAEVTEQVTQASKQPRFKANTDTANSFFASTVQWVKKAEMNEPEYSPDSTELDSWLRLFVRQEPHLLGVFSTAVSLDQNRGYSLIGGRNQVARFSKVLRNVNNGDGWRDLKSKGSQDYYSTNMGQITEVERAGKFGPLVSLYPVDSAKCSLTGIMKTPLTYTPNRENSQDWKREYFYRIASLPSPDEKFNGLGLCAVYRCLKIAQIMVALVEHNIEKLQKIAPKGIVFIESDSLTQDQWDQAWDQHKVVYTNKTGNEYFDEAIVIVDRAIKGDILAFSELPERFDIFKFTDYLMKAYALNFNYPTRFFWDIGGGSFGDVGEVSIQADRATQTGLANYLLQDQEQIQELLPPTLLFQYEEDDTASKQLKAELLHVWADAGLKLLELGLNQNAILSMMVREGIIDADLVPEIEDDIATDEEQATNQRILKYKRQQLLEKEHIQKAVQLFKDEPIVEYKANQQKMVTLWEKGSDAIKTYYQFNWTKRYKSQGSRQTSQKVLQQKTLPKFSGIVELGLNKNIDKSELRFRLVNYQMAGMVASYLNEATTTQNRTVLEQSVYDSAIDFMDNDDLLSSEPMSQETADGFNEELLVLILPFLVKNRFDTVREYSEQSDFFDLLISGYYEDVPEGSLDNRIASWENMLLLPLAYGFLFKRDGENEELIWIRTATDSCDTCIQQEGKILTRAEWQENDVLPGFNTDCNGWCQCFFGVV